MAPCHAFKPFSAALASFLHQTLAFRFPFARHQTLLKPSAAPWAGQTATTAPLYAIPKLDGTLPRPQTLSGALRRPDCHHSTSLSHSENDGWHPATPSNPCLPKPRHVFCLLVFPDCRLPALQPFSGAIPALRPRLPKLGPAFSQRLPSNPSRRFGPTPAPQPRLPKPGHGFS